MAIGLAVILGYLDYVLIPALMFFVAVTVYALRIRKKNLGEEKAKVFSLFGLENRREGLTVFYFIPHALRDKLLLLLQEHADEYQLFLRSIL